MAIAAEFSFANEADFTARLLIPLLHRLGFSIVVNYHGTREFGKDLIFGEIDHFGHVIYHGLQAKYVGNVGLAEVEGLIADCRQAFANPFRHPQSGAEGRITLFQAINGGTFSDQAREHFFNSLAHPLGGNIRLLDGKGVIALDRWAAANRSEAVLPRMNGLLREFRFNKSLVSTLRPPFAAYIQQHGLGTNVSKPNPIPTDRFR